MGDHAGGSALLATVRRGQTVENAQGRWLGLRDSPLTEEGRQQAMVLGARLKPEGPWAAIYTSPLGRAVDTAGLLAAILGAPVVPPEHDLREYDFGEWDGFTPAELTQRGFWAAVALILTNDARNAAQYALPNAGLALLRMDRTPGPVSRLIAMDEPVSCEIGV